MKKVAISGRAGRMVAAWAFAWTAIQAQTDGVEHRDYLVPGGGAYQEWEAANSGPVGAGKAGARAISGDGAAVTYTAFNSTAYTNLVEYRGKYTRLLLNSLWMTTTTEAQRIQFLDYADKVYSDYRRMIGKDPSGSGLLSIATVTTCGYGCGYVGAKGIELDPAAGLRDDILGSLAENGSSGVLTHEFAHNFDVFHNHMSYWSDWGHAWTRLNSVLYYYSQEGLSGTAPAIQFRADRLGAYDPYIADTAKNWTGCVSGAGCTDSQRNSIWAGLMFRFVELHGAPALLRYMEFLRTYTAANPAPSGNSAKEDLNVEAMAYGAQRNLGCYADRWRWNASAALRSRMLAQWGASNSNCQDNDADGFSPLDGDANDANPAVKPGGAEVAGNGVDDNSNGLVDETVYVEPAGGDFANNLAVGVPAAISGSISTTADGDRFNATLSQRTNLSLTLRSGGTFRGWLFAFKQDNSWLTYRYVDAGQSGNLALDLQPGTWAFSVEMNNASTPGSYQLDVQAIPLPGSWASASAVGNQLRLRTPVTGRYTRTPDALEIWLGRYGVVRTVAWGGTADVNIDVTGADAPGAENGASYSYGFRATWQGIPVVDWTDHQTFSYTASGPASVAVTGGTPQTAVVGAAFGAALQATVRDAGSNPVAGVTVTFSAPASGASASLSSGTATTNGSGVASITATANGTAGSYNVSATAAGVASPAVFALTNQAGAPGSIAVTGGTQIGRASW